MKKNIWIVLVILSISSLLLIHQYFDRVMPFVRVKITMDSGQARSESYRLADKFNWNLEGYDVAIQFKHDGKVQAFAELEGGGKQAFIEMIEKDYYQPYEWVVRFYKPGTIHEIIIGYTPDGKPYELLMKIPEAQPGAALSREQADEIAQAGAVDWDIDLSQYDFVEHHSMVQPSGRIDHSFVYQRHDVTLEKGLYRLKLKVCGDLFAQLDRSVKIPNEFERRYAQMFADNKLLANMARNIAIFLYLFVIALLVGIFFYRDRAYLLIRQHFYLTVVFGGLFAAGSLNQWPHIWCKYPTHMSDWLFALSAFSMMMITSCLFSIFVGTLCVIVDAADRYMFGRHIQFLKSWSRGVGGSFEIFQMTMLGYLFAVLALGYQVCYTMWTQYMGWWAPLNTLVDPNILSSYLPFLSPIALAFQAGFWEEFATRGLPLAGIAFLTRNSRYKGWWFGGMMCLQAIIFGALHANYPQMPSYYRVVELFLPSLGWGALYYWFGLLPGIIAHFVYDALLMCIPIWVSSLFLQKIMCAICILIPILVVAVYWFMQKRALVSAPASAYNHTTRYQEPLDDVAVFHRAVGKSFGHLGSSLLILFGFIGVGCLYLSKSWDFPNPNITITPAQAQLLVHPSNWTSDFAKTVNVELDNSWTVTSEVICPTDLDGNKFIWQTYGPDVYKAMLLKFKNVDDTENTLSTESAQLKSQKPLLKAEGYVMPPYYLVSWKKFTGSVEERAEELNFMISAHDQSLIGIRHTFPEARPGADLSEPEAQKLAMQYIQQFYATSPSDLELVSSETKKHVQRRDYKIVYKDVVGYNLDQGQGHITVKLAGDELSEIQRSVHVPESWQRDEQSRSVKDHVLKMILALIAMAWCFIAALLGVRRYGLSTKLLIPVGFLTMIFVALRSVNLCNAWVIVVNSLNTSEPWMHQIISTVSSRVIGYVALGFALSILGMLVVLQGARNPHKKSISAILAIVFAGMGLAGVEMLIESFKVFYAPYGFNYEFLNFTYPVVAIMISYFLNTVFSSSVIMMALCVVARFIEKRFHENWVVLLFLISGVVLSEAASLANIPLWIGGGLLIGVIWFFLYRCVIVYDIESILLIMFGMISCKLLPSMLYGAYPNIMLHSAISFVLFLGLLIGLYRKI